MIEWINPIPDPNISQQNEFTDKVNTNDQQSQINDDALITTNSEQFY